MAQLYGWVHDRFGTASLLRAEALFAIVCVAAALIVLREINSRALRS